MDNFNEKGGTSKNMKKIIKTRKDKILHFIAGCIIVIVTYPLFKTASLLILLTIGLLKELYDVFDDETLEDVEFYDLLSTILGGASVYIGLLFLGGNI